MEQSKKSTAFSVPGLGLVQYKRLPFGLSGFRARFQRLLDSLITTKFEPFAFSYIDDIIIIGETFDEHLRWLDRAFDVIIKAELTINRDK